MAELNGNELEGKVGPFGFRLKGRELVVIGLLVVLFLGAAGVMLRDLQRNYDQLKEHDAVTLQFHETIQDTMAALIYVTSITPEERKKLNLNEPKKIREMKRN